MMASSAPVMLSTPSLEVSDPPVMMAVARPVKVTLPFSPSWLEVVPLRATSFPSLRMSTSACGEVRVAVHVMAPLRVAVRRTAMTLSASDAMYSRRYSTSPAV